MQTEIVKSNLREYYNREAALRNLKDKAEWKISQRSGFANLIKAENKKTLLEVGAGTGDDMIILTILLKSLVSFPFIRSKL